MQPSTPTLPLKFLRPQEPLPLVLGYDEVWLEAEIGIGPFSGAAVAGDLLAIGTVGDPAMQAANTICSFFYPGEWVLDIGSDFGPSSSSASHPIEQDVYKLVELHWKRNTVIELYADNSVSPICTSTTTDIRHATRVLVGQSNGSVSGGSDVYFRNVKAGTTRHGTNIISDDFASGDFSDWTGIYDGAVTGTTNVTLNPF